MPARSIVLALSLASLLCACKREPSFEERYKTATEKISHSAREIDAQVAGTAAPPDQDEK